MSVQILNGPQGLEIKLDSSQVFPDDPGQGTPAMVSVGRHCATYACAVDTGELDCGEFELSITQLNWLQSERVEHIVSTFLENAERSK